MRQDGADVVAAGRFDGAVYLLPDMIGQCMSKRCELVVKECGGVVPYVSSLDLFSLQRIALLSMSMMTQTIHLILSHAPESDGKRL